MIRRARLLCVVAILLAGAVGVISSTQTWLDVTLRAGGDPLLVPGAAAVPVLAPLSLAVLALGAALSIVGTALRYVFGVLTVAAAVALILLTAPVAFAPPVAAVAAEVTKATGIAGLASVTALIAGMNPTPWPAATLLVWVVLLAAGALTLATAHRWRRTGRRYSPASPVSHDDAAPLDAVDSWDDLSRGDDPTR